MEKVKKFLKIRWAILVIGILVGALAILAIRYASYSPDQVHYHANFAVYLNGKRFEFKGPQYYQEVAVCSSTTGITKPQQRTHMHDDINTVIHVHDHAVTWGQFFDNLGWYVGPNFIVTDDGTKYFAEGDSKLHVLINDQDYTDLTPISNMVIQDKARLLLSFGDLDQKTIEQEYKSIPATADHYDHAKDPASCAGSEKVTPSVRLHHLF